jgi:hypothetical protein
MSKNNVSDLITDQEIAFARLILCGKMTDRQAAEAVGLDPNSAAYTKAKPRVRDYLLEHRAAVQQPLVEHDTQEPRCFHVSRDQVLARLWDIGNMEPERTRNSMSSQVKAISMIVAIEGLIPDRNSARHSDRSAVSPQNQPAPSPLAAQFYKSAWNRPQQDGESPTQQDDQQEAAPGRADDPPSPLDLASSRPLVEEPAVPGVLDASQTPPSAPRVPMADYFVPDTRVPFKIDKNRFRRRR